MAECDEAGNVNVGQFSDRLPGLGGFTNISQNARKIVFMGFHTCGGLEIEIGDGRMTIVKEVRLAHVLLLQPLVSKSLFLPL